MSIDNPLVIINSLTATVIKQQNEIEDLRASLKLKADRSALPGKYKELEQQLEKERFAGGMLRNYFIKSREDLIPELSEHIVKMAANNDRTIAPTAGILALSPIDVAFDNVPPQATSQAIKELKKLRGDKLWNYTHHQ